MSAVLHRDVKCVVSKLFLHSNMLHSAKRDLDALFTKWRMTDNWHVACYR